MIANDVQIGGKHYQAEFQHWDMVSMCSLDYFAGNASKYVSRHIKKHGKQDLLKAGHYLQKLLELVDARLVDPPNSAPIRQLRRIASSRFIQSNGWTGTHTGDTLNAIICWAHREDICYAIHCVSRLAAKEYPSDGAEPTAAYVDQG